MYKKDWERFSLGKVCYLSTQVHGYILTSMQLSAMREASLAREIHEAGAMSMSALYMGQSEMKGRTHILTATLGFYIHSCAKVYSLSPLSCHLS